MYRRQFLKAFGLSGLYIALSPSIVLASSRDNDGYWIWSHLGGDPRRTNGIWSWEAYRNWFLGPGGQNDMGRGAVPRHIQQKLLKNVQSGQYNRRNINLGQGYVGQLFEATQPPGSKYNFITFNGDGHVIWRVKTGFIGQVFANIVTSPDGLEWRLDTFKVCGNAAGGSVFTVTKRPPPPAYIPETSIPPMPDFYPGEVPAIAVEEARQKGYVVKGIFPELAYIAAHWLGATKISFSGGNATGGSTCVTSNNTSSSGATSNSSASSTTGPINIQNANTNQAQNINSVNTGPGNATSTGAQDSGTTQGDGP